MAKIVEIPFSLVRDHKAVRYLTSSGIGAYWLLVSAALWDGVDLAAQNDASLALIARQHMTAWKRVRKEVMKALAVTVPKIRKEYTIRIERSETHGYRSKEAWLKSYAVRMARKKSRDALTEMVEIVNPVPQLFQPRKIERYQGDELTDNTARAAASKRHKAANPLKTLSE